MHEDHVVGRPLAERPDPRGDRVLAPCSPFDHGRDARGEPGRGRDLGEAFRGGHDDDPPDDRRGGQPCQRPGEHRAPRHEQAELVPAAHARAQPGRDDDRVDPAHSPRGWAKIMRPATVWSTRVTTTPISRSRWRAPPSTTIIVPSSRNPTPWPASLPSWMTRTRSSSPGRTAGFIGVRERVDVHHPQALDLGDAVQVEVVREDDPAAGSRHRHELGVHLRDLGVRLVGDLDRDAVLLLEAGDDLEAAAPARPPHRVRAVGDPLELLEHDPRHDERSLQEARLGDVGDPAVDDRARVHDHARLATPGGGRLLAAAPEDPDRLGGRDQVVALGDRQPGHPEAQGDRDRDRQPRAEGRREGRQREAQEQAHQEAEEEAQHARHELGRRELLDRADQPGRGNDGQVRQDGEPDDEPGDEPEGDERARVGALAEDPAAAHHEREADEEAEGGAEETDDAGHGPRA